MNHALMLFSKFLERLTYFFFWSRFDTNFSTFPIFILSAKTDSSLWFLWSFKGYSTFTSKTYPSFVFVCFNQTRVLVVFGSLLNHKGSLRPIAGIVLLFHRLIVSPDSAFSCRVCVCVCVCVCVRVCVCFTSIDREGFICLDQFGHQGTDQRCYVENVNFLCQVPSLLL